MTDNSIARRYAKALFTLGSEVGGEALDSYFSSLEYIDGIYSTSAEFQEAMNSPIFTQEEKNAVLSELAKKVELNVTVLHFCYLLIEKNRMNHFPLIVQAFQKQMDKNKGVIRGTLVTAIALDENKQEAVLAELQKKTDQKLLLEFSVVKEILGGVILKVGDYVRDASLRTQLFILKDSIKRGE